MDRTNGKAGRPRGRKYTDKIDVPIEPERKAEFMSIAEKNGTNAAAKIRELITEYIEKEKRKGGFKGKAAAVSYSEDEAD